MAKRSNAGIVTVRAGRAQILLQARVSNDNTYTESLFHAPQVAEHICGLGQLPTATQREQVLYASSAPER